MAVLTDVDRAVLGIVDRIGFQSRAIVAGCVGGTDYWHRVDNSGNQPFEDAVKGSRATALDAWFASPNLGNLQVMKDVLGDINTHLASIGYEAGFEHWLSDNALRVDYAAGLALRSVLVLPVSSLHAPADGGAAGPGLPLGSLVRGGAISGAADMDLTLYGASPILARLTTLGSADWTLSVTCKHLDDTTVAVAQIVIGTGTTGAVGDSYVLGQQVISSGSAAGQKVVSVAATGQFKAGQTVVLSEWTGDAPDEAWQLQEVGTIASVQTNASITLVDNLKNSYTTAGFVLPCYKGVTAASGTGGSASDAASFAPAPDRRLKL